MIRLMVSNSWRAVLDELIPAFEQAAGHAVDVSYDPAKVMLVRIAGGETGDVALLGTGAIDQLIERGVLAGESRTVLARCGVGVAVRAHAAKPDISSVAALTRALLAARSVAYTSDGASGMHFARCLDGMGIADAVRPKTVTQPGGLVAERVARGEAEIAVQQIPELMAVAGVELVGPLPAALQLTTESAAGVFAATREPQAARAFIAHLATPAAARVMRERGMEPLATAR